MLMATIANAYLLFISTHGFAGENSDEALSILKKTAAPLESPQTLSVNAVATADQTDSLDVFKEVSFSDWKIGPNLTDNTFEPPWLPPLPDARRSIRLSADSAEKAQSESKVLTAS